MLKASRLGEQTAEAVDKPLKHSWSRVDVRQIDVVSIDGERTPTGNVFPRWVLQLRWSTDQREVPKRIMHLTPTFVHDGAETKALIRHCAKILCRSILRVMLFAKRDFVLCMYLVRGGVGWHVANTHAHVVVTDVMLLVLDLVIVSAGNITLGRADHDSVRQVVVMPAAFE